MSVCSLMSFCSTMSLPVYQPVEVLRGWLAEAWWWGRSKFDDEDEVRWWGPMNRSVRVGRGTMILRSVEVRWFFGRPERWIIVLKSLRLYLLTELSSPAFDRRSDRSYCSVHSLPVCSFCLLSPFRSLWWPSLAIRPVSAHPLWSHGFSRSGSFGSDACRELSPFGRNWWPPSYARPALRRSICSPSCSNSTAARILDTGVAWCRSSPSESAMECPALCTELQVRTPIHSTLPTLFRLERRDSRWCS